MHQNHSIQKKYITQMPISRLPDKQKMYTHRVEYYSSVRRNGATNESTERQEEINEVRMMAGRNEGGTGGNKEIGMITRRKTKIL